MTSVLVVEDNPILLESIALELEFRGYKVWQAASGSSALNMLRVCQKLPDLIISDIAMPDMDGFGLLEHIRSETAWNSLPFLFLTAYNSIEYVRASRELGADDYLVKPFRAEDLVLAIENKLKRIQAFRKAAHQELDGMRRELLTVIAHELRTPLVTIQGGSELLADHLANAPDTFVQHMLELIKSGSDRLNRLTNKALILLQIDSSHLRKEFQQSRSTLDMGEIVMAAVNSLADDQSLFQNSVQITVTGNDQSHWVSGLYEPLIMTVRELLQNAIAFSPYSGRVTVTLSQEGNQVVVAIQDKGIGISSENLPQIWERFKQIDRQEHEQQGLGLGLAIVRDIVRIHGGDCSIESEVNRGTCVQFWLPMTT